MIESTEEWFSTLKRLIGRLSMVRPGGNPSSYQLMTLIKRFLVKEKIGPENLRKDLIAVLDASIMKKNADEIAYHMRGVIERYQKRQLNKGTNALKEKMANMQTQILTPEQLAAKMEGREYWISRVGGFLI